MIYITVIPARGGSKRFPKKNIYPLAGKPLIAYSIEYSMSNEMVSATYVSTDSPDIQKVSEQYGAVVLKRPKDLAGDHVPTSKVLKQVAEILVSQGVKFDYMILLQATSPLRPESLLSNAIRIIEKYGYDSLMTVNRSQKKLGKIINNKFVPWNYKYGMRSQDMESLFYENGLLYITSKTQILEGNIIGKKMFPMVVDHIFGEVDIDTSEDMAYAEYVLLNNKKEIN